MSRSNSDNGPSTVDHRGCLIVCATPIGNLGDITYRVVEALTEADSILAEDTRVTRRLLNHLGIDKTLERCDENTIRQRIDGIVARIASGERLAYVSDAGTPSISDPGAPLIAAVRAAGLGVEVLPGASALLTALVASGFYASSFYFGGFLSRTDSQRKTLFTQLASLPAVLVFYESPHRIVASLEVIAEVFPDRQVCLARELTKLHEEVLVQSASGLIGMLKTRQAEGQALKGEMVLLIDMPPKKPERVHVDKYA